MTWNISLPPYDDHTKAHHGVTTWQLTLLLVWLSVSIVYLFRKVTTKAVSDADLPVVASDSTSRHQSNGSALDEALGAMVQLGFVMYYFYLCDYVKILPKGERVYNRDTFVFLVFLLFFMGIAFTLRPTQDKILNRDHTEEWKGWMQVMFVWYHYFAAAEWYNWIRVYIACYVWMTGFGNFSFFWVRKDFSWWRFCKMLFRLDFCVLVICAVVSNEFIVYYICAMHTYWFVSVYLMMAILRSWNEHRAKMALKFVCYAIANVIVFDVPGVADVIFRPLYPILGMAYRNQDVMHEWLYRVGLDHWVCFVGMLCAYNYPHFEYFIQQLESTWTRTIVLKLTSGTLVKGTVAALCVGAYSLWHVYVLPHDKFAYNRMHPYTSFVPILVYIILRNLSRAARMRYVSMFTWLGKVTLETYLSQLHVYLQSNAKHLLVYIDGYPLLNFALATIIYLAISFRLFVITNVLSSFFLPQDQRRAARNVGVATGCVCVAFLVGFGIRFAYGRMQGS